MSAENKPSNDSSSLKYSYSPNTVDPLNHENSHSMVSKAEESFSKEKEQPLLDGNNGVTRLPIAKETFMTPFTGFSTIINIVLATGPFTIPKPFNDSGIILGTLFLVIILIFAFITADFLVEALAISNALEPENLILDAENHEDNNVKEKFSFKKTIEVGSMATKFWGRGGTLVVNLAIAIYLYGALCIKAVSASQALSLGLAFIFTSKIDGFNDFPFNPYYICLIGFFIIVSLLALKNVQSTKWLQNIIAVLRYITSLLMIIGALIYIGRRGGVAGGSDIKYFDISNFAAIFGNVVFAFLSHHSLPGILKPIRPETSIKKVIFWGYICGCMIMYMVALTAVLAFGDLTNKCEDSFPCALQTLYNENFLDIPFIGHVVNFYLLFNIAPFPILTMTLRNNLIKVFAPSKIPADNTVVNKWTLLFTAVALVPVFVVSVVAKDQLSKLLSITGGFCGVILMLMVPSALIISSRKQAKKYHGDVDHVHKSLFSHRFWPILVLALSVICFVYSGYINIISFD